MNKKKSIIVYGLGKDYELAKNYIESKFNVIGYSDKVRKGANYILPADISKYEYDYICITSSKYFQEITNTVVKLIGEGNKDKVISIYDTFGDFRNYEIRDQWVINKLGKFQKARYCWTREPVSRDTDHIVHT